MERIRGLDSIRFVCALWVVISHFGRPPLPRILTEGTLGKVVLGLFNNVNGPAAVIIFFVISGFCIHYPYSKTLKLPSIAEFYVRRYLRIGIPLLVAVPLSMAFGNELVRFQDNILWSLIAEILYYTIYPILLWMRRIAQSWWLIYGIALTLSLTLAFSQYDSKIYPVYGPKYDWLMGLPCWMAGCLLAEFVQTPRVISRLKLWLLRLVIISTSFLISYLKNEYQIFGYPWTITLFSIPAAIWLYFEISYYMNNAPSTFWESLGLWSYSLYLFHCPIRGIVELMNIPNLGFGLNWALTLSVVILGSYVFYLLFERPGQNIARRASRHFKPNAKSIENTAPNQSISPTVKP